MSVLADARLASELAEETGQLLRHLRTMTSEAGDDLGRRADREAHQFLSQRLQAFRPEDVLLSEEGQDNPARLQAARLWIVDPLDGSREYAEGRSDYAVHVALVESGMVTAAAVALPEAQLVVATHEARRLGASPSAGAPVLVSRSRRPAFAEAVASALNAPCVACGSAGYKAMQVLLGQARAYVHAGGIREWDVAAPAGVALAAGLYVSDLAGQPLSFNQADLVLGKGLIICWPEDAARILQVTANESSLLA